MEKPNAKNHMLCWNPNSSEVDVVAWPDTANASRSYMMTALACYSHTQKMNFEQRKTMVFVEAMHLIVRDKVDPMAVHNALLKLEEYQHGCACDMPGIEREDGGWI